MAASTKTTRTADSTDRAAVLPATKSGAAIRRPGTVGRLGGAAKRFLSALMRSLATPHV